MEPITPENHPLNLNSSHFDSEIFVNNLLQKKSLDELVAVEEDMVQNVRRLDSEMQQLVYENYNKFLAATNTVRNMQTAFTDMDNEMHDLSVRMKEISKLSESVSQMFCNNRRTVRKLMEKSKTVERLQYFVKLPALLKDLVAQKNYKRAVEIYVNIKPKLERYSRNNSMFGIYSDCKMTMEQLEKYLHECLSAKIFSSEEVIAATKSLIQFGISEIEIRTQLLDHWEHELDVELQLLNNHLSDSTSMFNDILEFVDNGCCAFLTNISLYISLFVQLFNNPTDKSELLEMINIFMNKLEKIVINRFQMENNSRDCALFIRALDRICRKISVLSRIIPDFNFSRLNATIVVESVQHQISINRDNIKRNIVLAVDEAIYKLNQISVTKDILDNNVTENEKNELICTMISRFEQSFLVSVKTCLANLLLFNASDINLCAIDPVYFNAGGSFSVDVYETIIANSVTDLRTVTSMVKERFLEKDKSINPILPLSFAAFLHNLKTKQLEYLINLSQEQFKLTEPKGELHLTSFNELAIHLSNYVEDLLKIFVEAESLSINSLIESLIQSLIWSKCNEPPKCAQDLVKNLLQEVYNVSKKIQAAAGEINNAKKELFESCDLSTIKKMSNATSCLNAYEIVSLSGQSLGVGGIMERLWGDEHENATISSIFDKSGIPAVPTSDAVLAELKVKFQRDSIVTAIICVCIRKMTECIIQYEKPFTEFELQQLQVDCAYMKYHLWELINDEHILNILIDDCIAAAIWRCPTPKLLDPAIVRSICEEKYNL